MTYSLSLSDKSNKDIIQIEDLVSLVGLNPNEYLDYDCDFILAHKKDKLIGFIGVLFNRMYPQFQHIVIHPNFQSSRVSFLLANYMENFLRAKGYKEYVAYVSNELNNVQVYAQRIGLISYANDTEGVWFAKKL